MASEVVVYGIISFICLLETESMVFFKQKVRKNRDDVLDCWQLFFAVSSYLDNWCCNKKNLLLN